MTVLYTMPSIMRANTSKMASPSFSIWQLHHVNHQRTTGNKHTREKTQCQPRLNLTPVADIPHCQEGMPLHWNVRIMGQVCKHPPIRLEYRTDGRFICFVQVKRLTL